ncbi:MAG TPA: hypothetical protein VK661_12405 [Planctomycetota bacterium]|nr:hypothetical protein [Planctomycetota bacterium]
MKLASIAAIIVGLVGCSAPAPKAAAENTATQPFGWLEVLDAVWDTVEKDNQVWVDDIRWCDDEMLDQERKAMDLDTTNTGIKYAVLIKCHVGGTDVKAMTAFRKELKANPTLSRLFPIMDFGAAWRLEEHKESADKFSLHFEVLLVNKG